MEVTIYDKQWIKIDTIDTIESLIWTSRFNEIGDFEIYTEINKRNVGSFVDGRFLSIAKSEDRMLITSVEIKSNAEFGNKLLVKGVCLKSILKRRIIWRQTILSGNLQTEIIRLLNENVISPTILNRKIDNFTYALSTDPAITSLTVDTQFTGDYLVDAISKLCKTNGIGFKVLRVDDQYVFELYSGKDRSYSQSLNPYVVFSQKFDNIISSNYYESSDGYKSVALVAGEGEGINRITKSVALSEDDISGIDRRELFVDARDISSYIDGEQLSLEDYELLLSYRGAMDLFESKKINLFEGQADTSKVFIYGEDFFLGDIVQTENEYGNSGRTMVVNVMISENISGINIYPSFETIL